MEEVDGAAQTPAFFAATADGMKLFIKEDPRLSGILLAEVEGLKALADSRTIRLPKVYFSSSRWLIMEAIQREPAGPEFWQSLGESLVVLHRNTGVWGWPRDNFLGRMVQHNHWPKGGSWSDFFWEKRLLPQIEMLRAKNIWGPDEERSFIPLQRQMKNTLDRVEEAPSLLHGDLWSGNILCGVGQEPVLIDPAVSYGHRETDLAMSELFGGFSQRFYQTYKKLWPLADGYPRRRLIYNFYHKLNHANLYGSGYIWDVKKTLLEIVSRP